MTWIGSDHEVKKEMVGKLFHSRGSEMTLLEKLSRYKAMEGRS